MNATPIGTVGNAVKVPILPTASAQTYDNGNRFYTLTGAQTGYTSGYTYKTVLANSVYSWVQVYPTPNPIEVGTDAEMTALLVAENEGKVYKFTGTTGTYKNGEIYIVEVTP